MIIEELIKDVSDICLSYLTNEEQLYIKEDWDKLNQGRAYDLAIKNGWLDLLQWLHKYSYNMQWVCYDAACYGHLNIIKWAVKNDLCTAGLSVNAAYSGHLEILKWVKHNSLTFGNDCYFGDMTCYWAAKGGHLEIL